MEWLYVLIGLGVVLSIGISLAIGFAVNKAADKIRNAHADSKNSQKCSLTRQKLRDLYPDYTPNVIKPAYKNKITKINDSDTTHYQEKQVRGISVSVQIKTCCLCGGNLEDDSSMIQVIQKNQDEEIHICRKCGQALGTILKSNNINEVIKAGKYIYACKTNANEDAVERLNYYLKITAYRLDKLKREQEQRTETNVAADGRCRKIDGAV
ncbi:MAG: hypothetical protein E7576_15640 [Ruminococcaceae bacterium]|nr:hypothetical protein [Oscillospiraceae bacterium]